MAFASSKQTLSGKFSVNNRSTTENLSSGHSNSPSRNSALPMYFLEAASLPTCCLLFCKASFLDTCIHSHKHHHYQQQCNAKEYYLNRQFHSTYISPCKYLQFLPFIYLTHANTGFHCDKKCCSFRNKTARIFETE